MHTEVYSNTAVPAQAGNENSVILSNTPLDLLPEHHVEITRRWMSHIVREQISGSCLRVITAIFRQTLGFNKFADDMNGKRLEQVTQIRYDHANAIVRALEADNAVITRKGRYGHWMSINFNFASWRQTGKKAKKRSNDPRILLPDYYRDTKIDAGEVIGASLEIDEQEIYANEIPRETIEDSIEPQKNLPEQPDLGYTITNNNLNNTTTTTDKRESQTSADTELVGTLLNTLDRLENQLEYKFQTMEHNLQTQMEQKIIEQTDALLIKNTQLLQQHQQQNPTIHPNPPSKPIETTQHRDISATEQENNPVPSSNTVTDTTQCYATTEAHAPIKTKIATAVQKSVVVNEDKRSTAEPLVYHDLRYPSSLAGHTQQVLKKIFIEHQITLQDAQNLVDLLDKRLQNTYDPIRSISSYLVGLIKKLKHQDLDLSPLAAQQNADNTPQTPPRSEKEKQMDKLQWAYRDAMTEYNHFEKNFRVLAAQQGMSLRDYMQAHSGKGSMWTGIKTRLEESKAALDLALNADT